MNDAMIKNLQALQKRDPLKAGGSGPLFAPKKDEFSYEELSSMVHLVKQYMVVAAEEALKDLKGPMYEYGKAEVAKYDTIHRKLTAAMTAMLDDSEIPI